jgi:hypothetical protein
MIKGKKGEEEDGEGAEVKYERKKGGGVADTWHLSLVDGLLGCGQRDRR